MGDEQNILKLYEKNNVPFQKSEQYENDQGARGSNMNEKMQGGRVTKKRKCNNS